jgi:hypothetical protein
MAGALAHFEGGRSATPWVVGRTSGCGLPLQNGGRSHTDLRERTGPQARRESHMLNIRNKTIVATTVTAFGVILASGALSKADAATLAGSDQTKTLDCAGGWARIAGAHNNVTLTGNCAGLRIYGSRNNVMAAFQEGATVRFVGSENAVTWTTPDGSIILALATR